MKKIILSALLALTTGCSSYTLLPEPYETRYFSVEKRKLFNPQDVDIDFNKKCGLVRYAYNWYESEKNVLISEGSGFSEKINKYDKYNVVAKSKDSKKIYLKNDIAGMIIPVQKMKKCTINEQTYKAEKIAEQKKAAAIAEQKRKAKEAEAAKAAAEKRTAEKEAARKNNAVLTKYGKPLCNPYEAGDSDEVNMLYYNVTEKKKNCLFMKKFKVSQTVSDGFLAYTTTIIGWSETTQGPYFIVKNKNDADVVDDEEITGLFEYIGTYSYDSVMGPKKVLKFKHVR